MTKTRGNRRIARMPGMGTPLPCFICRAMGFVEGFEALALCLSEEDAEANGIAADLITFCSLPGKGRGVIAKSFIAKGTQWKSYAYAVARNPKALVEEILKVRKQKPHAFETQVMSLATCTHKSDEISPALLRKARKLDPELGEDAIRYVEGVVLVNSFEVFDHQAGLFPLGMPHPPPPRPAHRPTSPPVRPRPHTKD